MNNPTIYSKQDDKLIKLSKIRLNTTFIINEMSRSDNPQSTTP